MTFWLKLAASSTGMPDAVAATGTETAKTVKYARKKMVFFIMILLG